MKKLLMLVVMMMSFNAFSGGTGSGPVTDPLLLITITTMLPTIMIMGNEIDLNSQEAQERLQAELNGDVEPVLLDQLAIQKNITTDELKALLQR